MTARLARLRARMAETRTDLVALGPTSHMLWLAGSDPHGDERPVMLLVSPDHAGFLMPALNAGAVRAATDLPFETWDDAEGPGAALARLLAACGVAPGARVAVDEAMRADFALLLLDALDAPERTFCADTLGHLRARKEPVEVEALRSAQRVGDAGMRAGMAALRPGATEREVAAAIDAAHAEAGAATAFAIVAFGANSAFPHHHTGDAVLADGMAVLIDSGACLNGYPSDTTRCRWFGGAPDPEYLRVAETVDAALRAALAAARPGARASDVDAAARDVIAAEGHGEFFVHRTGHGIGIDGHEPPWITATSDAVLAPGMAFSVEPGIYLPGRFGVRLEEVVVLAEDGPEILSVLPRDVL